MFFGYVHVKPVLPYFVAFASFSKENLALEVNLLSVSGCFDDLVDGNVRETLVAEVEGGYAVSYTESALHLADLA